MDLHSEENDKDTNTVWLFHGTSTEAAELITRGDFLVDKAGSNAGTLYGRGIYLAESCSKSDDAWQQISLKSLLRSILVKMLKDIAVFCFAGLSWGTSCTTMK